jgi:hypothetical protein
MRSTSSENYNSSAVSSTWCENTGQSSSVELVIELAAPADWAQRGYVHSIAIVAREASAQLVSELGPMVGNRDSGSRVTPSVILG